MRPRPERAPWTAGHPTDARQPTGAATSHRTTVGRKRFATLLAARIAAGNRRYQVVCHRDVTAAEIPVPYRACQSAEQALLGYRAWQLAIEVQVRPAETAAIHDPGQGPRDCPWCSRGGHAVADPIRLPAHPRTTRAA